MRNKLKPLLLMFALVLSISVLLPQTTKAATVSVAEAQRMLQLRINAAAKTVTIDWNNFTANDYILVLEDSEGHTYADLTVANTGSSVYHRQFSTASFSEDPVYKFRIYDKADPTQQIHMGFFIGEGDGITSGSYDTTSSTLSWVDQYQWADDIPSYQYQLRFYTSQDACANPTTLPVRYAGNGARSKVFNSSVCASGTYWVSIQPFYKADNYAYYGAQRTVVVKAIYAPTNVTAKADVRSVKVSWSPVAGATSYVLKNLTTKESITISDPSQCTYTFKNLSDATTYKFCIYSKLLSGSTVKTSDKSTTVSATTPKLCTSKVTDLQVYALNGKLYIQWKGVSDVNGYNVYYKKSGASEYTLLGNTVSSLTYPTSKFNTYNADYTFMVKPYVSVNGKKYDSTAAAPTVTANPYKLLNEMSTVRTIGYFSKTVTTTKLYNSYTSTTAALTIGSGKEIEQLEAENTKYNRCKVLYNNKVYYCKRDNIKSYAANYTTKHYSTAVKEAYVKNKTSNTKYLIWVSQYTQQVSVFQGAKGNWKMIKTFICATGKHTTRSARGTYKITKKEDGWFYSSTYEKYITHFFGRNSFHTRIHTYGGGYSDATIGRPKSNGCVRLYDDDAYYIWKNMPIGTTVVSY